MPEEPLPDKRAQLIALHDDLVRQHSLADDPQKEATLLKEITIIEFILFYGETSQ